MPSIFSQVNYIDVGQQINELNVVGFDDDVQVHEIPDLYGIDDDVQVYEMDGIDDDDDVQI